MYQGETRAGSPLRRSTRLDCLIEIHDTQRQLDGSLRVPSGHNMEVGAGRPPSGVELRQDASPHARDSIHGSCLITELREISVAGLL